MNANGSLVLLKFIGTFWSSQKSTDLAFRGSAHKEVKKRVLWLRILECSLNLIGYDFYDNQVATFFIQAFSLESS